MYGNRYKTLKKIISFLYIDEITMFLLKGRVTERTEQKTIKRKEDKEMSKLDTVQRELCRKLGDEYRIMRIDYRKSDLPRFW